jgi:hypothetical protein
MKLRNIKITNKGLYWGLIVTFAILYFCVGFVSTLHSITFFHLANATWLAVLLGLTYEIGQASVLFSILMTRNKDKFLPWLLMILLTALQVTANVYASFKYMASSGSSDWVYWQKSILFGFQASNAEMYQVVISWIAGALLPIVALGMTALVAQNIKLAAEEDTQKNDSILEKETDLKNNNILDENEEGLGPIDLTKEEPNKIEKTEEPSEKEYYEAQIKKIKEEYDRLTIANTKPQEKFEVESGNLYPSVEVPLQPYIKSEVSPFPVTNLFEGIEQHESEQLIPEDAAEIEELVDLQEKISEEPVVMTPEMKEQYSKDFIMPTEPDEKPKKRGRPPKQKEDQAVELKKEQELLPSEDVEVPQKPKRFVDPLKRKTKIKPIENLEEVIKPSLGDEVIKLLENIDKEKAKDSIMEPVIGEEISQESLLVPSELRTPYIENSGVEIIDVKAIPKEPEVKKN